MNREYWEKTIEWERLEAEAEFAKAELDRLSHIYINLLESVEEAREAIPEWKEDN